MANNIDLNVNVSTTDAESKLKRLQDEFDKLERLGQNNSSTDNINELSAANSTYGFSVPGFPVSGSPVNGNSVAIQNNLEKNNLEKNISFNNNSDNWTI